MRSGRFRKLLDIHGADLGRWPAAERDSAQALLTISAEARSWQAEARSLDGLLDAWPAPAVSDRDPAVVAAQIVDVPQRTEVPVHEAGEWRFAFGWTKLTGLAAAAVVGFVVGWSGVGAGTDSHAFDETAVEAVFPTIEPLQW